MQTIGVPSSTMVLDANHRGVLVAPGCWMRTIGVS